MCLTSDASDDPIGKNIKNQYCEYSSAVYKFLSVRNTFKRKCENNTKDNIPGKFCILYIYNGENLLNF
jgi:hypothetical protein